MSVERDVEDNSDGEQERAQLNRNVILYNRWRTTGEHHKQGWQSNARERSYRVVVVDDVVLGVVEEGEVATDPDRAVYERGKHDVADDDGVDALRRRVAELFRDREDVDVRREG